MIYRYISFFVFSVYLSIPTYGSTDSLQEPFYITTAKSMGQGLSTFKEMASSLFIIDQRPTWRKVSCKASIGLTGLFSFNALDSTEMINDSPFLKQAKSLGFIASTGILGSAAADTAYLLYDSIRYFRVFGAKTPTLRQMEQYNQLMIRDDQNIGRLVRGGSYAFNTACTALMLYTYYCNLMQMTQRGINPFALAFPDASDCPPGGILCAPLTTPVFLSLNLSTLIYNVRELSYFFDPLFSERGDIPFFAMMNGMARVGISAYVLKLYGIDPYTKKALKKISPDLYTLYLKQYGYNTYDQALEFIWRYQGNYQLYSSIVLMFKNGAEFFINRRNVGEIDAYLLPAEGQIQKQKRNKTPELQHFNQTTPPSFEAAIDSPLQQQASDPDGSNANKLLTQRKEKAKTRGMPDPDWVQNQPSRHKPSPPASQPQNSQDSIRSAALQRINDMRTEYPIKVVKIDREIAELTKFLGGSRENVTGSEVRLTWNLDNKRFFLKFETPHGFDSSNYAGNKLNRILNTLEVGYIMGWDKNQIQAYIEENNRHLLLRSPKLLYFVLGHRNR